MTKIDGHQTVVFNLIKPITVETNFIIKRCLHNAKLLWTLHLNQTIREVSISYHSMELVDKKSWLSLARWAWRGDMSRTAAVITVNEDEYVYLRTKMAFNH